MFDQVGYLYALPSMDQHDSLIGCQFDNKNELLWAGTHTSGLLTSFMIDSSSPDTHSIYTRFPANRLLNGRGKPVQMSMISKFHVDDLGVYSVCGNRVSLTSRQGIRQWSFDNEFQVPFSCLAAAGSHAEMVLACQDLKMLVLNRTGKVVRQTVSEEGLVDMKRHEKFVACSSLAGSIFLKDPKTLKSQITLRHSRNARCSVADFDVVGNFVVSCAYQQGSGYDTDSAFVVHDMRNPSSPLSTVQLPVQEGTRFIAANCNQDSTFTIASAYGSVYSYDAVSGSLDHLFNVDTKDSYLTSMSLSTSGSYLAFSDAMSTVHLFQNGDCEHKTVSMTSDPILLPTPFHRPAQETSVDDYDVPLSSFGLPHYTVPLYSAQWPVSNHYDVGCQHPAIPSEVLASIKQTDFVGYAPNLDRGRRKRNQVSEKVRVNVYEGPKFRSQRERERSSSNVDGNSESFTDTESGDHVKITTSATLPSYYKKPKIKYGRFGIEDFDFSYYNSTQLAGLENDISNCYLNALLQVLFHGGPDGILKDVCVWHLNGNRDFQCEKDPCLTCELGFLFRMMEDAQGSNCQAKNFLRAFTSLPEVTAMGLLEDEHILSKDVSHHLMIQKCNRFIFERVHQECAGALQLDKHPAIVEGSKENSSAVQQLFTIEMTSATDCSVCKKTFYRDTDSFSIDLNYPKTKSSPSKNNHKVGSSTTFIDILNETFRKTSQTRAWCEGCRDYALLDQYRYVRNNPAVLNINCGGIDNEEQSFWKNRDGWFQFLSKSLKAERSFVPTSVYLCQAETSGHKEMDNQFKYAQVSEEESDNSTRYDLASIICQVRAGQDVSNLVSFVRTGDGGVYKWFMFNDFAVKEVSEAEAVQFKSNWKVPAILQYIRYDSMTEVSAHKLFEHGIATDDKGRRISNTLFNLIVAPKDIRGIKPKINHIKPLSFEELLAHKSDFLIGIDAEFVALTREEVEIKADGSKSLIKPSSMHLARLSLVRGQNYENLTAGSAITDDYIFTESPVADYLTEFSGINPDDLNIHASKRTLVSLKNVYRKIRYLLDAGVKFLGHGLKKDFRTINIFVRPEQVIDTVVIYRIPGQRHISLRYLAWYVLGKDIQQQSHDSIVDAQIALELYRKYEQLNENLEFEKYLLNLYEQGRKMNWKAPHWREQPAAFGIDAANSYTGGEFYRPKSAYSPLVAVSGSSPVTRPQSAPLVSSPGKSKIAMKRSNK